MAQWTVVHQGLEKWNRWTRRDERMNGRKKEKKDKEDAKKVLQKGRLRFVLHRIPPQRHPDGRIGDPWTSHPIARDISGPG